MNAPRPLQPRTRAHLERSCKRKRRYPDHITALAFAIHEMESNHGLKLDTYRCRYCSGWHLFKLKSGKAQRLFRAHATETA